MRKEAVFLVWLLTLGLWSPAYSGTLTCQSAFKSAQISKTAEIINRTKLSLRTYTKEIVETRGQRLMLKKSGAGDSEARFFTKTDGHRGNKGLLNLGRQLIELPSAALARSLGMPGYRFTPFRGFYEWTFVKPVEWLSSKVGSGQKLRLSRLIEIPLVSAASMLISQPAIDHSVTAISKAKVEAQFESQKNTFNEVVKADYRYRLAREAKSPEARSQLILAEQTSRKLYFDFLNANAHALQDPETAPILLRHPYFSHLTTVWFGIGQSEGFRVPRGSEGALTAQQKGSLLKVNHELQIELEVLASSYNPETHRLSLNPKTSLESLLWKDATASKFSKYLIGLRREHILDDAQLLYRLQEDAVWRTRFKEWFIVGIERLQTPDGVHYTDEVLTIDTIRSETLAEIRAEEK
ncbi:MAG: hypothetical protein EOP06_04110 [Proteobacteria bacterium]|nr:MAG: hypothetical protein EOP06_04110 [Pseudomonadota bacterium]